MKPSKSLIVAIVSALAAPLLLVALPLRPEVPTWEASALAAHGGASSSELDPRSRGEELREEQQARERELAWGRDPFQPPTVPAPGPAPEPDDPREKFPEQDPQELAPPERRPHLTGISLKDGVFLAIVDRHIVRVGDRLPTGHIVQRLAPTSITLLREDQQITLVLGEER